MFKKMVFAWSGCLLALGIYAQTSAVDSVLVQVERNNPELRSLAVYGEARRLELKSGNNLPDPQFGAYFLPFGNHNSGDYTEFQLSQSFEFPTVYSTRAELIEQQMVQQQLSYRVKRQEILAQAKALCLRLIYLEKRLLIENDRAQQARQVLDQIRQLFELEQVGILDRNKAELAWMQEQFKVKQIESEINAVKLQLTGLNGGHAIAFTLSEYGGAVFLPDKEALWQEKLNRDPELIELRQSEVIAGHSLELAKRKTLPGLTAGINMQGVSGAYYTGAYAGLSIPLWSNRYKIKAAESLIDSRKASTLAKTMLYKASFEKLFNDYEAMFLKFKEYESAMGGIQSEALLLQAHQSGELSFLQYYMELQFYRQAQDAMQEMQYQLFILKNQMLKHQL